MKKTNKFLLIALIVLTLTMSSVLVGCNCDGGPNVWKVTFDYNYTGAPSATVVDVNDGETVAVPTSEPTRADYDFTKWFTDSTCTAEFDFTTAITADTTLYAGWELKPEPAKIWKVTFDYNYPDAPSAAVVDVNDGETVAVPTQEPTRSDEYTFAGWFTDSACTAAFVFTTAITADTTLYAGWEATVLPPDAANVQIDFTSEVAALEGTWEITKVYVGGTTFNAVPGAIMLEIVLILNDYKLMPGDTYLHNQIYEPEGVMTFGIAEINEELSSDGKDSYEGDAYFDSFTEGEENPEELGWYHQPGPAIMSFDGAMNDWGLFLDLVAPGVSSTLDTYRKDLIIAMNDEGQLLLGYSTDPIEWQGIVGDWTYCLIFDKAAIA